MTITEGSDDTIEANKRVDERKKEVIFRNCSEFIECRSEINNTLADHAKKSGSCNTNV